MSQNNEKITPPTTYTVQEGDTLSGIAQRAYGNGSQSYWMAIYSLNVYYDGDNPNPIHILGDNPNLIHPGVQITLPALKENPTVDSDSLYIVKPGDTLWGIVERYIKDSEPGELGTAPDVQGIVDAVYAANKEVIGNNPNLIHPGQVLYIPGGGGGGYTH